MAESSSAAIRRYLEEAIAAEASFEGQLRAFSEEGDDDEVRATFAQHADETRHHHERLSARLEQMGGSSAVSKSALANVFSAVPKLTLAPHRPEERTAQNLIVGFAVEASECALYEVVASIAKSAGDTLTEFLAREIQAEERRTAERIWHFIPSRAKIAFNMLTVGEVDPSVETKAMLNRIV
jgi:ferritin-like metal-binding protein YciE